MQISMIIHLPEEALTKALEKDGMTREQFVAEAKKGLTECWDDLCPGATAEIRIAD